MSTQNKKLSGKVAPVTGASKGIGAVITKRLAAEGAAAVVNDASSKAGADKVVAEITGAGGKAVAVHAPKLLSMKKTTNHKNTAPVFQVNENVSREEQIAQRAHELWQQRRGEHGNDLTDWFQAEREINEWHQKRLQAKMSRNPGLAPKSV